MGLADSLAALNNVEPEDLDPEDQDFHERANQESDEDLDVLEREADGEQIPSKSHHYVKVGSSKLRTDVPGLDPEKYAGAKRDRRSLLQEKLHEEKESSSGEEGPEEITSSEELEVSEEEDSSSGSQSELLEQDNSSSESQNGDENEPQDDDETLSANAGDQRDRIRQLLAKEQNQLVNRLTTSVQSDALKGQAVEAQSELYESLLDLRIKLQKALTSINPLPISSSATKSASSEESANLISGSIESLLVLLNKLSQLRQALISYDLPNATESASKRRKFSNLKEAADDMVSKDVILDKFRKTTLDKWSNRVQSASGAGALQNTKFKALNQSASAQVESVLSNMDRLVQRTQINRSGASFLGSEGPEDLEAANHEASADAHLKTNVNIFDDSDFYKQLLKDFVDRRMLDSVASAGGVKWAVSATDSNYNKNQLKPGIDRKASKGRRLRYDVKDKLQNYMAPRPDLTWTEDQMDDLFAGLLGRRIELTDDFPVNDEQPSEEQINGDDDVPDWSSFLFAPRKPKNAQTVEL